MRMEGQTLCKRQRSHGLTDFTACSGTAKEAWYTPAKLTVCSHSGELGFCETSSAAHLAGSRSKLHLLYDSNIFVWAGSSGVNSFFSVSRFSVGLVQSTFNVFKNHHPLLLHSYGSQLQFASQSTHLAAFTAARSTLDPLDLLPRCPCTSSITVLSRSREWTHWKNPPLVEQNEFGFVAELTPPPGAVPSAVGGKDNDGAHQSRIWAHSHVVQLASKRNPKAPTYL